MTSKSPDTDTFEEKSAREVTVRVLPTAVAPFNDTLPVPVEKVPAPDWVKLAPLLRVKLPDILVVPPTSRMVSITDPALTPSLLPTSKARDTDTFLVKA